MLKGESMNKEPQRFDFDVPDYGYIESKSRLREFVAAYKVSLKEHAIRHHRPIIMECKRMLALDPERARRDIRLELRDISYGLVGAVSPATLDYLLTRIEKDDLSLSMSVDEFKAWHRSVAPGYKRAVKGTEKAQRAVAQEAAEAKVLGRSALPSEENWLEPLPEVLPNSSKLRPIAKPAVDYKQLAMYLLDQLNKERATRRKAPLTLDEVQAALSKGAA